MNRISARAVNQGNAAAELKINTSFSASIKETEKFMRDRRKRESKDAASNYQR